MDILETRTAVGRIGNAIHMTTSRPRTVRRIVNPTYVDRFPPAEQLSNHDLERVCDAFRGLLFSWNADISLPDALPLPLRYQFMVKTPDERFTVVNAGFIMFDYCSGNVPDCPYKQYCPRLEFWDSSKASFKPDQPQRKDALS